MTGVLILIGAFMVGAIGLVAWLARVLDPECYGEDF